MLSGPDDKIGICFSHLPYRCFVNRIGFADPLKLTAAVRVQQNVSESNKMIIC
jgi:hypothetical protein